MDIGGDESGLSGARLFLLLRWSYVGVCCRQWRTAASRDALSFLICKGFLDETCGNFDFLSSPAIVGPGGSNSGWGWRAFRLPQVL